MSQSIASQVSSLRSLTIAELRKRYTEVFEEEPRSRNKDYLFKRVAFRLQEMAEGGLSERAKGRAAGLAREADLRIRARKEAEAPPAAEPIALLPLPRDKRLPKPGALLKKVVGGKEHVVKVLAEGFEHDGKAYRSLSAVARAITGTRWNGFAFFDLNPENNR